MRNLVSAAAAAAVTLSLVLLSACNGTVTPFSKPSGGLSPLGEIPLNAACENGKSGVGIQTPRTQFIANGRYINLKIGDKAPEKFFIKGMTYSPTPIGNGLGDPPSCDDPLRNDNKAIWSRDLRLIRAMRVNAIRVFNVSPPPYDEKLGTINEFLDAAWNKGNNPVYVLMTIFFPGDALNNDGAANDISGQYERLAAKYALYPAVMGVSISNEITGGTGWTTKKWWDNYSKVADGARRGFASKGVKKLVTSADFDGVTTFDYKGRKQIAQIYYGEQFGARVDAWGDNIYRGRWFTDLLQQIEDTTTKPVILTEYGATAAYHPAWANTYEFPKGDVHRNGVCVPNTGADGPINRDAAELPGGRRNPNIAGLVDYVTNMAELLHQSYKNNGLVSGGFYFEWNDEWWKADANNPAFRSEHVGNLNKFTAHFPGCSEDAAWFGLNSIKKGAGVLDTLTPRPTLNALKVTWAKQQP